MESGDVIADRFIVGEVAGRGGMGVVHAAVDRVTGGAVALKTVRLGASQVLSQDARARFEREARVLAELDHPGVVRHVAHGESSDGTLWLALEWVEGETLHKRLARGAIGVDASIQLVRSVAETLAAAHARGVVHRDVKPSNILLEHGDLGRARLIDFGIARWSSETTWTTAGAIVGTTGYMAPEQARGSAHVDGRADVFSLGCVLYHCIAGVPPFAASDSVASLIRTLLDEPKPLDDVPPSLGKLVLWMLAKDVQRRAPAAGLVAARLSALAERGEADRSGAPGGGLGSDERAIHCLAVGRNVQHVLSGVDLGSLGIAIEPLIGGLIVVTAKAADSLVEEAHALVRAAIALAEAEPKLAIAIVTARTVEPRAAVRELASHALALIPEDDDPARIRLDRDTARLVRRRVALRHDADGAFVAGGEELPGEAAGRALAFIGRERELAALTSIAEECFEEKAARAVLLTGPVGIGKSRLARELVARIRALGATTIWHAFADASGADRPLALAGELVAGAAGGRSVAAIEALVALAPDRDARERSRIATFLCRLVDAHGAEIGPGVEAARHDPGLMGDQLRRAFIDLVAGAKTPIVIVLEDIQWADLPSLVLIGALLRALERRPLLVVATAQEAIHERAPKLWHPFVEETFVRELPSRTARAIARAALDRAGFAGLSEESIVARCMGNPLFIEELAHEADRGSAPETVLAMMQTRSQSLDADTRRALRAASIFGQAFSIDGVRRLLPDDDVDALLEIACAENVVASDGTAERWVFRHELVREEAYATLTDVDRRRGHALAAAYLEEAAADPLAIADHYDRSDAPVNALPYLQRAAAHAVDANDFRAALATVARALRLNPEGETLGALLALEAVAHRWQGDFVEARRSGARARALLAPGTPSWYQLLAELSVALGRMQDVAALRTVADDLLRVRDTSAGWTFAAARVAAQFAFLGEDTIGRAMVDSIPDDSAVRPWVDEARAFLALNAHPTAMVEAFETAGRSFDAIDDRRNAALMRIFTAEALVEAGDLARAMSLVDDALAVARVVGTEGAFRFGHVVRGRILRLRGELGASRAHLAAALTEVDNKPRLAAPLRSELAATYLADGDFVAAEREATAVREVGLAPPMRVRWAVTLAEALLARNDALGALGALAAVGDPSLYVSGALRFLLVRADALERLGRHDTAAATRQEARDRARTIADGFVDREARERWAALNPTFS